MGAPFFALGAFLFRIRGADPMRTGAELAFLGGALFLPAVSLVLYLRVFSFDLMNFLLSVSLFALACGFVTPFFSWPRSEEG